MGIDPTSCVIRKARLADLQALQTIEESCFTGDRLSKRSIQRLVHSSTAGLLVASSTTGLLVAYTLVFFRKNSSKARLYSLAVMANYRKLGLASQLMEAAEDLARHRHCQGIRLEVSVDNKGAIKLYESRGYVEFGKKEAYYEDGSTAILYEKHLSTK